jgi:uncharacterized protein HemY
LTLELQIVDGSKIQKEILIEVTEYVSSISKTLIIVLSVIIGVAIIVMVLVFFYYKKIVRNLRDMYSYMKRRNSRNARHVEV